MSEIEPEAGADGGFDAVAGFEGDERGIADEQGGVGLGEHGDGVGGRGEEFGVGADELAEEDLRVGERAARGGVGGDGADSGEGAVDEGGVGVSLLPHLKIETPTPASNCARRGPRLWGTHSLWLTRLDDELDGADTVKGCDGAVGDDGE